MFLGRYAVADVLGNLYQYYRQFSTNILAAKEKMSSVVVKEFNVRHNCLFFGDFLVLYFSLSLGSDSSHAME